MTARCDETDVSHDWLAELTYRALPRVDGGRLFAHSEWLTLVRAAEVLLDGSPVAIRAEEVADNVERFLVRGASPRAWRIRALLTLVEWLAVAETGSRFSVLSPEGRRRLVERRFLAGRGLWRLCAKMKYLVLLGAYGDDRAAAPTGFVPVEERARFGGAGSTRQPPLRVAS